MKCPKCGFIHDGNLSKCPYCGQSFETNDDFLSEHVGIGSNVSIKRSTLFDIVLINLFLISVFLDGVLSGFSFGLTIYGYILFFGIILLIKMIQDPVDNPLQIYFRIDIYIFFALIISFATLGNQYLLGNIRPLISLIIAPCYFFLSTNVLMVLFFLKKSKLRILEATLVLPFRFLLSLTLFIFCVIYSVHGGDGLSALFYSAENTIFADYSLINQVGVILNYVSFAFIGLLTFNATLFVCYRIMKKVNYTYG